MLLQVEDVSFSYGKGQVIDNLSLSVNKGEVIALIGSSGSGKTTLFKLIAGLLQPCKGAIHYEKQALAYMTQQDLLLPWRSVMDNMTLTAELGTTPSSKLGLRAEAMTLLSYMGLSGTETLFPDQLSGGMRQRLSLARELLLKRPLLLLDEPFGSLDACVREQMYSLLDKIKSSVETTIVLITHDFRDALLLADRVLLLSRGTISKEWVIPPETRSDVYAAHVIQDEMKRELTL